MPATRSSARIASKHSSPSQSESSPSGTKRKNDASGTSPSAKRGRKSSEKTQMTIEDSMATESNEPAEPKPESVENAAPPEDKSAEIQSHENVEKPTLQSSESFNGTKQEDVKMQNDEAGSEDKPEQPEKVREEHNGEKAKADEVTSTAQNSTESKPSPQTNGDAIEPEARENDMPSSILEKGIIYFFFRPRVNIDEPQDVNDVARSYFVMRPIPIGAKLGDGTIGDDGNCRVIALPKKVLPLSGKDRFMTFVEKSKISFKELRENFLSGSEYATQTVGTRHTPPTTPVAEGVYALTSTGRESHLAYILTIPSEIGDVQKDLGLRERGSFITSVKNPEFPGPANASLPQSPGYSQEIMKEFRGLRWMSLQPKLLDYVNTQFLLIGESGGLEKAMEEQPRDQKQDTNAPMEEIEKLEGEDEIRIKGLKGDDAVFADLGLSSQEYPKVPSTWF